MPIRGLVPSLRLDFSTRERCGVNRLDPCMARCQAAFRFRPLRPPQSTRIVDIAASERSAARARTMGTYPRLQVLLHRNRAEHPMTEDLRCPDCDSPAVIFPQATNERAGVRCGGCGKLSLHGPSSGDCWSVTLLSHAAESRLVTTGC
jgi:ribosomal protein S27E